MNDGRRGIAEATLRELREAAGVSQEELATRLKKGQPALSRMERQRDARVSTLHDYVAALGGELDLVARVGEREVRLSQFDTTAAAAERARRATPPTLEYLRSRREEILRVAEQHGAYNVRVFGSVVRGEATADSDVDFLIDLEEGRGMFDLADLYNGLQTAVGHSVDIVTERSLRGRIRDYILADATPL